MAETQTIEQTQQPEQTQQQPTEQTTVDYKKQYEELQAKHSESEEAIKNFEQYFNTDTVAAQRAKAYLQAVRDGKDPQDAWKALETPQDKPKKNQAPEFDKDALINEALSKLRPEIESVKMSQKVQTEQAASLALERDKAKLFKDEPWLTDELYTEFDEKFGKKISELTSQILSNKGPFLTSSEKQAAIESAENQALGMFSHLSDKQLLHLFMGEHRDKYIANGRPSAQKLPEGMATDLPTGKAPQLLEQLKKAYKAAEGNGSKVADLVKEFSPKLGMSEEKVYALVANE